MEVDSPMDDPILDELINELIGDSSSSHDNEREEEEEEAVPSENSHHIVLVKKRKYDWKISATERRRLQYYRVSQVTSLPFPRILKNDFRRKFIPMFINVVNSYNYHLICSFFSKFLTPNVQIDRKGYSSPSKHYETVFHGVQPVLFYYLILLQMGPDKVTSVTDIQLKQYIYDLERTEIVCKFVVKGSKFYEISPSEFLVLQNDLLRISNEAEPPTNHRIEEKSYQHQTDILAPVRGKKRPLPQPAEGLERFQVLFDPVSGDYVPTRFPRKEQPKQYSFEAKMRFIINQEKRIERMMASISDHQYLPTTSL